MKTSRSDDSQGLQLARQRVKAGSPRAVALVLTSLTAIGALILGSGWLVVRNIAVSVQPRIGEQTENPSTAILSARRVPSVLSDDVRFRDFQARLDAFASRLPEQSCFTVDVEGRRMVTKNGSSSFLPASNMKLLIAAAALATLGPDYRFATLLYGNVENGLVVGDLTVVGGGDPTFQSDGYETTMRYPNGYVTNTNTFVEALRDIGVSGITGSVVVDEGRYDTERWAPTLGLGVRATEVGPLGAMMINDGAVLGDPLKPDNPALAAARELTRVLLSAGIAVDGTPQVRTVAQQTDPIAQIDSPPLSEVLVDLLANSDNNHAELILKELGVAVSEQGTREAGLKVVSQYLQGKGIDVSSLTMIDGAGLDRANRFSCDLIQTVLLQHESQLFDALSLAGRRGTLRELFIGNAMEGRLRGKTGTLTGAKALSGYVPYSDDENITFALILNGPSVANQSFYRPLWNAMGDVFASLKESPSVAEIAPFAS